MKTYIYSQWTGCQESPTLDIGQMLTELGRALSFTGDIEQALWRIQRNGIKDKNGTLLPGNCQLLQILQQKKQKIQMPGDIALLHKMDVLESQLEQNQRSHSLDDVNLGLVSELLGEDTAIVVEQMRGLKSRLLDAGYLRLSQDSFELTPRAIRKIGEKAIEEVFSEIRKNGNGRHPRNGTGNSNVLIEETKQYESGDEFNLHLNKTVMNAVLRNPGRLPLKIRVSDFEIVRKIPETREAVALMLDMSRSMVRRDNFLAAKKVALALHELTRTRFPFDSLYVLGFATYASRIQSDKLPYVHWNENNPDTNLHHGLILARQLLERDSADNKRIMLITDGEPTAHIQNGRIITHYPPSPSTLKMTLEELSRCVGAGIRVSVFLFEGSEYSGEFIRGIARTKSQILFTSNQKLGQYLLIDYLTGKRKIIV